MNLDRSESSPPPKLNVLVIAYYFPPMGLSGVQRTLKFVKYLPDFGWRPIVLTAGETPYYAHDESLLDEIQPLVNSGHIRIARTAESGVPGGGKKPGGGKQRAWKVPSTRTQRLRSKIIQTIYQPDSRVRWKKPALALAEKVIREERIDAIFSTAPPFTDFIIARHLSRKHNIPYLMDYRDAWVGNSALNFYATPFHKAYAQKLEFECLRGSSAITVVNRWMKEVLLQRYDFLTHNDVTILPHGYDPEDLTLAEPFARSEMNTKKFRLTYSGILGAYYVGRVPLAFFQALKLAVEREPEFKKNLELVFVGVFQEEYRKAAKEAGLTENLRVMDYRPHVEAVATLLASDVLWFAMSRDVSAPGKLYEYIGTRKPILGLVPADGQAARILHEYGAGVVAPPDDVKAIAGKILELYAGWKSGGLRRRANEAFVKQFDRRELTQEVARQLGLILRS
jgi:glycosyltransferase involved in cell wall biosynthesis